MKKGMDFGSTPSFTRSWRAMGGESGEGFSPVGRACEDEGWDWPWETRLVADMTVFKPAGAYGSRKQSTFI